MENDKNNKKAIMTLLIGIGGLLVLIFSATYAYFSVSTSNNFGTRTITGTAEATGSVALNGTSTSLRLNLTGSDMMKGEDDITYWATSDGTPSTTKNVVTIGSTQVTGAGDYNCNYTLSVTGTGTNNMYTAFQGMSGKSTEQIVLKIGDTKYDFNTASLFPITINGTLNGLSSSVSKNITAEFYLVNKESVNQNALAGTDLNITITATSFNCSSTYGKDYNTYLRYSSFSEPALLYNQSINKANIESIEFLNTVNVPTDGTVTPYDVSYQGNGKIMASIVSGTTSGKYKLYIGQNGGVVANPSSQYVFYGMSNLKSIIGLENFDTSRVTTMHWMFYGCSSLTNLDLSTFDTSNVTNMEGMFASMSSLTSLDLSNFDTSNVTNMSAMFSGTSSLTTLNLGQSFDTSNVTRMTGMFNDASALTTLNLGSKFDTSNVIDMGLMFGGVSSVSALDLGSKFDTSKVKNMSGMFFNMRSLTNLNFGNKFTTSNVRLIGGASDVGYYDDELGNSFFEYNGMFEGCSSLRSLDLSGFNTSNVLGSMNDMFSGMSSLTTLNLGQNFDTSNVAEMSGMFMNVSSLATLNLGSKFDTSNVIYMINMFNGMSSLTALDLGSNFDTSNVTDMAHMFSTMSSLTTLNLGQNFDTSNVISMEGMFEENPELTTLDLSSFDTSNVESTEYMFEGCNKLRTIYASNTFVVSNPDLIGYGMFYGCQSLIGGNGTRYSTNESQEVDDFDGKTFARIDAPGTPGYFTLKSN